MGHSKFGLDGPAFEDSTRQVMQPHHVVQLHAEAEVDTQLFQTPPGLPAPQEEQEMQAAAAAEAPEDSVLKCIMEVADARGHLHAFREFEHYALVVSSESDSDVPEEELTSEMEDIFSEEDQLVSVTLQEEEGQATEGGHDQSNPVTIPVDDDTIEENIEPSVVNFHSTLVNVQVPEPRDPRTPRYLDDMEGIVTIEEDRLVPENLHEAEHFTEDDRDLSSPVIIWTVEDMCTDEDDLNPVNLEEEENPTGAEHHDQTNPVIIPVVKESIAVDGNETSPGNLHLMVVSIQGKEPDDPSTPRRLDVSIATFDCTFYPEADPKVIPGNQLDVKVQTVTEGESSNSSNLILMDIKVDRQHSEPEESYERHKAVTGVLIDVKDVNGTRLKRATAAGAAET